MRTVRVLGACLVGSEAELVTVEARFDRRDRERTEVVLTGLPDAVIRESRGRLVCALEANGTPLRAGDALKLTDERDVRLARGQGAEVLVFDLP